MNALRVSIVAALATTLFACGGAQLAPTKEAAAQALFASSRHAQMPGLSMAGATPPTEVSANCARGGKAIVKYDFEAMSQNPDPMSGFEFEVRFENCSDDGRTTMNGSLVTTYSIPSDDAYSPEIELALQGRVNFSGAISDFVDANVAQRISITQHGTASGTVTVRLAGTITTSGGTFTYDESETVSFEAGELQTEHDAS